MGVMNGTYSPAVFLFGHDYSIIMATIMCSIVLIVFIVVLYSKLPPCLGEAIPFVSNAYQFVFNQKRFLERAAQKLQHHNLVRFYLGPVPVNLVVGSHNIQTLFRPSHSVNSDAMMLRMIMPRIYGMPKHELERFAVDHSGVGKSPSPGSEGRPAEERYWYGIHNIYAEYLSRAPKTNRLGEKYYDLFMAKLNEQPVDTWETVSIFRFCKNDMAQCAIEALVGSRIFELNPGLVDAFWDFESSVGRLYMGLPSWINPQPLNRRERFFGMVNKYLGSAWEHFDWGTNGDAEWDPHFGARVSRELAKWVKERGFSEHTASAFLGTFVFATNTNTIPITTWTMMELAKDPELLKALREEVVQAFETDSETSLRTLNIQKLLTLPLFNSVFVENMRLHMSFNVLRQVNEPIEMEGYMLGKGSIVQAPMQIAHHDETIWGAPGRPASEFWGERHIQYVNIPDEAGNVRLKRQFALKGRPSSFFPYGGGTAICPGRHFAKQEVMMSLALLISKFDVEFVEWTNLDLSVPSRAARDDGHYAGAAAMPPDRDMKIRWKRLW